MCRPRFARCSIAPARIRPMRIARIERGCGASHLSSSGGRRTEIEFMPAVRRAEVLYSISVYAPGVRADFPRKTEVEPKFFGPPPTPLKTCGSNWQVRFSGNPVKTKIIPSWSGGIRSPDLVARGDCGEESQPGLSGRGLSQGFDRYWKSPIAGAASSSFYRWGEGARVAALSKTWDLR